MRRFLAVGFLLHAVLWAVTGCGSGAGASFGGGRKGPGEKDASAEGQGTEAGDGRAAGSGSADGRASGAASSGAEEPADRPGWINGSWLTCSWGGVTATQVEVRCALDPSGADVEWRVVTADGVTSGPFEAGVFVLDAAALPDAIVLISSPATFGEALQPMAAILPGLDESSALAECLRAAGEPRACLEQAGVTSVEAAPAEGVTIGSPTIVDGVSYYLGIEGASCTDVCAGHGGPRSETRSVVGSGGTSQLCVGVSAAWGHTLVYDHYPAAAGLGCHIDPGGEAKRVVEPATDYDSKAPGVSRICACAS
jgi:hypothetical protein